MMEQTLLVVKPDGVARGLTGRIISRLETAGLKMVAMKIVLPNKEFAGMHYAEDKEWMESVGNKTLATFKEKGIPASGDRAADRAARAELSDNIHHQWPCSRDRI